MTHLTCIQNAPFVRTTNHSPAAVLTLVQILDSPFTLLFHQALHNARTIPGGGFHLLSLKHEFCL